MSSFVLFVTFVVRCLVYFGSALRETSSKFVLKDVKGGEINDEKDIHLFGGCPVGC